MDICRGYLLLFMLLIAWNCASDIEGRTGAPRPCRGSRDCGRGQCCVIQRRFRALRTCQPRPRLNETCSSASLPNTQHPRAGSLYFQGCPCRHVGLRCRRISSNQEYTGVCRPFFEGLNVFNRIF
ncbi:hypothetical protein MTO96_039314 [Rhipicephalus appendiculatus]